MGVCSRLGYFDDPLIRAIDNFNLGRKSKSPLNVANSREVRRGALEYFVVIAAWGRRLSFWRRRERS